MIRPKQAKKILPKSEFEAFEAIIENQISRMSATRLKQKATVSRRLRDKYRDLARRQGVAAKRKLTNETDLSHNETRAQIFHEIIDRIAEELERPGRRARPPRKKAAEDQQMTVSRRERDAKRVMRDAKRRSLSH